MELLETAPAQGPVGGPVGVVEGPPCRPDGALHVVDRGVGHLAEQFLGGRIDVPERPAAARLDQLSVNQHPRLWLHPRCIGRHSLDNTVSADGRLVAEK